MKKECSSRGTVWKRRHSLPGVFLNSFIEVNLTYNKLYMFKVSNLGSFGISMYP